MTFRYTDPDGDSLYAYADTRDDGTPVLALCSVDSPAAVTVHIDLDRVEEVIAGLRDTTRQAATPATAAEPYPPIGFIGGQK